MGECISIFNPKYSCPLQGANDQLKSSHLCLWILHIIGQTLIISARSTFMWINIEEGFKCNSSNKEEVIKKDVLQFPLHRSWKPEWRTHKQLVPGYKHLQPGHGADTNSIIYQSWGLLQTLTQKRNWHGMSRKTSLTSSNYISHLSRSKYQTNERIA